MSDSIDRLENNSRREFLRNIWLTALGACLVSSVQDASSAPSSTPEANTLQVKKPGHHQHE